MGKARTFDSEDDFVKAVESGSIEKGKKTVVILRYLGPQGGPGEFRVPPCYVTLSTSPCFVAPKFWVVPSSINTSFIFVFFSTGWRPFLNCSLLPIGMPEMLKPTSLIMGAGLGLDVACLTDGRFSGG